MDEALGSDKMVWQPIFWHWDTNKRKMEAYLESIIKNESSREYGEFIDFLELLQELFLRNGHAEAAEAVGAFLVLSNKKFENSGESTGHSISSPYMWPVSKSSVEQNMMPGKSSMAGFLGQGEVLSEIVAEDTRTLEKYGVSHAQIAARIEYFIKAVNYPTMEGKIIDGQYKVSGTSWRGFQDCPWNDNIHQYGSMDFTIINLKTGEAISFPGLIVHLIGAHHFFEGKKTNYRVDPERVIRVLEIKA